MGTARPQCAKCLLYEDIQTPFMNPDLRGLKSGGCDVLFVGEAPGRHEDTEGIPFVGNAGQILRDIMHEVGLDNYSIAFTNMIRCRPPENKTPTTRQVGYCIERVREEVEELSPRVVVLLGNVPLKLIGESGISAWRGAVLERDSVTYFPTFHPSAIQYDKTKLPIVYNDLDKVVELINGNVVPSNVSDEYDVTYVQAMHEAEYMLECILHSERVAFDTESNTGIKPFSEGTHPIYISFAVKEPYKQAWVVKLGDLNLDSYVQDILFNPDIPKVGHFTKYDSLVCFAEWGKEPSPIVGDCMLQSYVLDPTPGRHGLKQLAGQHLGMFEYDLELRQFYTTKQGKLANPAKGGDMSLVPEEIIVPYSACDAIATVELNYLFDRSEEMTDSLRVLYEQLLLSGSKALLHMEEAGMCIDDYIAQQYLEIYNITSAELYEKMTGSDVVMKYVAWREKQLRKLLPSGKDTIKSNRRIAIKSPKVFIFNPNSSDQMADILFDPKILKDCTEASKKKRSRSYYTGGFILTPTNYTVTGMPSAAWKDIKVFSDTDPFLKDYRYFKLIGKMVSTYLRPSLEKWRGRDGKARSSYSEINTSSGRLASSDPNFQNIPTPEKEPGTLLEKLPIRNIITSSWWTVLGDTQIKGTLLAGDYSGMELRTMASIAGCQNMIEMFMSDKDIHSLITTYLYNVKLEEVTKPMRYRAKWVNWTLLYGGDEHTLVRTYGISMEEAVHIVKVYYGLFPEILDYKRDTIAFVRKFGYSESKFGRRRYFPYINDVNKRMAAKAEREAVNMPIQSTASDVLFCALIVLDDIRIQEGWASLLVNTVHDQVAIDVCPGELEHIAEVTKDVMENIITTHGPRRFPGLDFSWFVCPLKADLEIGINYGNMEHYSKGDEQ